MDIGPQGLLIAAVIAVGILHTLVPDHWLPITILARQQGWSRGETVWAAARAGFGHVASTLAIGALVYLGGVVLAERYGAALDIASSAALVAFGGWIALAALREMREGEQAHGHPHPAHHHQHTEGGHPHRHHHHFEPALAAAAGGAALRHTHLHRHGGPPHLHWHDHEATTAHPVWPGLELDPPPHEHAHQNRRSTTLLLILGSSPMVEGIPAFFAAGRYGAGLIGVMAAAFAASTIATYVALCTASVTGLQRLRLGAFERYGEVASGALIAAVGLAFGILSIA